MDIEIKVNNYIDNKVFDYQYEDIKWVNKNDLNYFYFELVGRFIVKAILK